MKLLLISITIVFSSNVLAQFNPSRRTEELAVSRGNLEIKMENTPYYGEEHATIKRYFTELQILIDELEENSRSLKRFNEYLREVGTVDFCSKALLENDRWSLLVKKCTKNNFFLCSEEVKLFPNLKKVLIDLLEKDFREQALENCK